MKRLNSHNKNILLIKDDVGKPKPSVRRLPDAHFSYGRAEFRDVEDAQQGKILFHCLKAATLHTFYSLPIVPIKDPFCKILSKTSSTTSNPSRVLSKKEVFIKYRV